MESPPETVADLFSAFTSQRIRRRTDALRWGTRRRRPDLEGPSGWCAWRMAPRLRADGWPLCLRCGFDQVQQVGVVTQQILVDREKSIAISVSNPELHCPICSWRGSLPRNLLSRWLVFCPGVHAYWSYFVFLVVHLRALNGVPAATRDLDPEAEHELTIFAVEPRGRYEPPEAKALWDEALQNLEAGDVRGYAERVARAQRLTAQTEDVDPDAIDVPVLTPPNVRFQFHGLPDQGAALLLRYAVEQAVGTRIWPDSDYRVMWRSWLTQQVDELRGLSPELLEGLTGLASEPPDPRSWSR